MIKYFNSEKEMFDYINEDNYIKYLIKNDKIYYKTDDNNESTTSQKWKLIKQKNKNCKKCKYFIFCTNIMHMENANVYINNKCDIKFKLKC